MIYHCMSVDFKEQTLCYDLCVYVLTCFELRLLYNNPDFDLRVFVHDLKELRWIISSSGGNGC